MNKIRTCLLLGFLISGCNQTSKTPELLADHLEKIDLTDLWESKPEKVRLSAIADSIFYIPLQATPQSFLKGEYPQDISVELLDKYIVVHEEGNTLKLFGIDGKYLLTFGAKGKGPGEYMVAREFATDEARNRVYILDWMKRKIIVFDFLGKLVSEIDVQKLPGKITIGPEHQIGVLYLSFGDPQDTARLEWLTEEGRLEQKIPLYQNRLYGKTGAWGAVLYWINGRLRIMEPPYDTIYQLNSGREFAGVTAIIQGPKGLPREIWFNSSRYRREASDYYIVHAVYDCKNCLFIRCNGKRFIDFLYNKLTGQISPVRREDNDDQWFPGLYNDLDGGLPFLPYNQTSEYLISCMTHDHIKSYFNGRSMTEPDSAVNPLLNKRFIKMAEGLNKDDNPVVVVVRMKK